MKGMKVHGPDGRTCDRIERVQVGNESTLWVAEGVLSVPTCPRSIEPGGTPGPGPSPSWIFMTLMVRILIAFG